MRKTSIHHWRYETGEPEHVGKSVVYPKGWREGAPKGWYCWAYPMANEDFEKWMDSNCPNAEYTFRFNSGDPMYTVYIKEEKEAVLFQLKWM